MLRNLSIIFFAYLSSGHGGSWLSSMFPASFTPAMLSSSSRAFLQGIALGHSSRAFLQDVPEPGGICNPSNKSWAWPRAFAQMNVPWTPFRRGVPKASWLNAQTTSIGQHREQQLYSKFPLDVCAPCTIFKVNPSHWQEKPHFSHLYLWPFTFGYWSEPPLSKQFIIFQQSTRCWISSQLLQTQLQKAEM